VMPTRHHRVFAKLVRIGLDDLDREICCLKAVTYKRLAFTLLASHTFVMDQIDSLCIGLD
jgi:hypothetical protein